MNIDILADRLRDYVANSPENAVQASYALREDLVGVPLFDAPIVGVASADDPFFERIHNEDAILGDFFRMPTDWLPGAKSVISIFYPFTREVRESNYDDLSTASPEWLHSRIEGQQFMLETGRTVASWLEDEGYETCIPALSPDFAVCKREPEDAVGRPMFRSTWSERHVAFTAGLGTFDLTAHLITRVGKAGRFGSVITAAEFEPTPRPYGEDPYAYCTRCGACTRRCPVNAITLEHGKDFQTCWKFVEETKIRFAPRYGCGKCQLKMPCETGIPG